MNTDHKTVRTYAWQGVSNRSLAALGLILAVSLLFRCWYSNGQSITFDENYEIQLAQRSIPTILTKGDGFPPLYAILLRIWQHAFGTDSARAFSIALGAVCCVAVYQLGRLVDGNRTGLWSAAILAILPIHLFYSSEARAYSLLFVIATSALCCTLQAIYTQRKRYWFGYALLVTAGLHTHYLFALFAAITMTVAFFQMGGKRWYPVAAAVSIWAMIAPLVLLWAPADFQMQNEWAFRVGFGPGALAYTYGSFLMGYTLGPSLRALHGMPLTVAFQQALPWAVLIATGLLLVFANARNRFPKQRRSIPLLLAIALAPVGMGVLCNIAEVGYQVRYSIWAVIPCIVYLAFLATQAIKTGAGRFGLALLTIAFAAAIWNRHYVDEYRNADLEAASEVLKTQPDAPILVVSGYMAEPLKCYFGPDQEIVGIPMTSDYENRTNEMAVILERLSEKNKTFSLIYTREFHEDPDGVLMQQLQDAARITPAATLAGVKLYQAEFRREPLEQ